jgi:AcrR family transcriptional regulator
MKKLKSRHSSTKGKKFTVIRAALACFTENGYTDTSISDVCGRSGMSVGSLYHHFKSKEQLAAAVYLEGIRDYQQGYIEALESGPRAQEGVIAIVRYHLKWVEGNPDWARFLFQKRHADFMGDTEDEFNRLNAEFFRQVSAWFRKHIESGAIRRLPPDLYLSIMMGPCQEYSRVFLSGQYATPVDKAVNTIGDAVWRALVAQTVETKIEKMQFK